MLQSEAGYIDARPLTASSTKFSCNARPDHTSGHEPPRHHRRRDRSSPDCVAKLRLRRITNDDSVGLRRASTGAAHDGSARRWTRPVLLFV